MLNAGKYNKLISIYQVEDGVDDVDLKPETKIYSLKLGQCVKQQKVLH